MEKVISCTLNQKYLLGANRVLGTVSGSGGVWENRVKLAVLAPPHVHPSSLQGWLTLPVECRGMFYVRWLDMQSWHPLGSFFPQCPCEDYHPSPPWSFCWEMSSFLHEVQIKGRQREKHQIPMSLATEGFVLVVCKEQRYRISMLTPLGFGQRQPQVWLWGKAWEPEVCRGKLRSHRCRCCRRLWSHRGPPSCFGFVISGILFLGDFLRWWYLYIPLFLFSSCFPSYSPWYLTVGLHK